MSGRLSRVLGSLLPGWSRRGAAFSSRDYWLDRYRRGGNSGAGSYNHLASFKAEVVNDLVARNGVGSVIEFGCGDGNQLQLAAYPQYLGVDISQRIIDACRQRFRGDDSKRFVVLGDYQGETAELSLSLDVVFHLVEDEVFNQYMCRLFDAATRFVIVYSSNTDHNPANLPAHVRHRKFSTWVSVKRPEWTLKQIVPNRYPYDGDPAMTSFADFFIYEAR